MKLGGLVGDLLSAVFVVAIIYVLVRPQSKAGDAVRLISDALVSLVKTATDI